MAMFTLKDAIGLAENSKGLGNMDPKTLQYNSAIKGDYVLSDAQALYELERRAKGEHGLDNPKAVDYLGNPGGKLPGHPTFSSESPYHIKGLMASEGGDWSETTNGWQYAPSKHQFTRDPNYVHKLAEYFNREKGNGIDAIKFPTKEDK